MRYWHHSSIYLIDCFYGFKNSVSYFCDQYKLKTFKRDIIGILFWLKRDESSFVKCLGSVWKSKYLDCQLLLSSLYTVPKNRTQWLISYFAGIVGPCEQPVVIRSLGYKAKSQQVAMSFLNIFLIMQIYTVASLHFYTCGVLKFWCLTELLSSVLCQK